MHYSRWKRHGDPLVVLKDHTPPEQRWRTSYIEDGNGCWVWQGVKSRGYGIISCGAHSQKFAHRFVFELLVGKVPEGTELDHLCRNRACIRPDHLEPVPHEVNVQRGEAGIANSSKTHCKHGHEFTAANTYHPAGQPNRRACVACQRRANRESMRRRRAAERKE